MHLLDRGPFCGEDVRNSSLPWVSSAAVLHLLEINARGCDSSDLELRFPGASKR